MKWCVFVCAVLAAFNTLFTLLSRLSLSLFSVSFVWLREGRE